MISKDYIIINGVSSDTVDLYIDTPPAPPMSEERVNTYQVGMDEDMAEPEDSFKDVTLIIKCYSFFKEDFDNADIYGFIQGAKTLQVSRLSDKYYRVRSVKAITPSVTADGKRINYSISFTVAPFRYSVNNEPVEVTQGSYVHIDGTRYSRPIFHIVPAATGFALFVNGVAFSSGSNTLTAGQEYIIDSERLIFYTGDTLVFNTTGKYPLLNIGDNLISWEGVLTSVTVEKNERWR